MKTHNAPTCTCSVVHSIRRHLCINYVCAHTMTFRNCAHSPIDVTQSINYNCAKYCVCVQYVSSDNYTAAPVHLRLDVNTNADLLSRHTATLTHDIHITLPVLPFFTDTECGDVVVDGGEMDRRWSGSCSSGDLMRPSGDIFERKSTSGGVVSDGGGGVR